jgi:hypothetical protein
VGDQSPNRNPRHNTVSRGPGKGRGVMNEDAMPGMVSPAEVGRSTDVPEADLAAAQGKRRPSLTPYGIDAIKRLARRFGTKALHWTE